MTRPGALTESRMSLFLQLRPPQPTPTPVNRIPTTPGRGGRRTGSDGHRLNPTNTTSSSSVLFQKRDRASTAGRAASCSAVSSARARAVLCLPFFRLRRAKNESPARRIGQCFARGAAATTVCRVLHVRPLVLAGRPACEPGSRPPTPSLGVSVESLQRL